MEKAKRMRKRCYNCIFRGDLFKIGQLNNCHCQHSSEQENYDPWDTLREFWSKCEKHELATNHLLNTNIMNDYVVSNPVGFLEEDFILYAAATELARLESQGSGELNRFDHLAKDLHKEGFDEKLDTVPQWKLNAFRITNAETLKALANERYSLPALPDVTTLAF